MPSSPRTPPRPAAAPARPAPRPAPGLSSVLEFELSTPIKMGIAGELSSTIRFVRPPGIGELDGWLDESDGAALEASLGLLPFRPAWQIHVLTQCAGMTADQAKRIPASDFGRLGFALAPFLTGSRATGAGASSGSLDDSDGGPETSQS